MMKKFFRRAVVATSFAAACLAAASAQAAEITWRLQTVAGAGTTEYKDLVEKFAKYAKELTDGRLEIKTYPAGMLMKSSEVVDAVSKGTLDGGHTYLVYYSGKEPALKAANEWPTEAHPMQGVMWFYEGGGSELMRKIVAKHGMYMLGVSSLQGEQIWTKKPLAGVDDLKGLKVRAAGLAADSFAMLGASVVAMPGEELYQALQRGVIDAVEFTSMPVNYGLGFHEVVKQVVLPAYSSGATSDWVINAKSWEKLPKELKPKVEHALQLASYEYSRSAMIEEAEIMKKLAKAGVEFAHWSEADMQKMAESRVKVMKEKYAAESPEYAEKLASQLEFLEKLGYSSTH